MVTKIITTASLVECIKARVYDGTVVGKLYILDKQSIWIDSDGTAYAEIYDGETKAYVSQAKISRFKGVENILSCEVQNIYAKENIEPEVKPAKIIKAMMVRCTTPNNVAGTKKGGVYYIDLHDLTISNITGHAYGFVYTPEGKRLAHTGLAEFQVIKNCVDKEVE